MKSSRLQQTIIHIQRFFAAASSDFKLKIHALLSSRSKKKRWMAGLFIAVSKGCIWKTPQVSPESHPWRREHLHHQLVAPSVVSSLSLSSGFFVTVCSKWSFPFLWTYCGVTDEALFFPLLVMIIKHSFPRLQMVNLFDLLCGKIFTVAVCNPWAS